MTYRIVRFFKADEALNGLPITRGLTPEQAQAHCSDKETSSETCTRPASIALTEAHGPWFDGMEEER